MNNNWKNSSEKTALSSRPLPAKELNFNFRLFLDSANRRIHKRLL